jgi:lysophospholipase L1-like esterase
MIARQPGRHPPRSASLVVHIDTKPHTESQSSFTGIHPVLVAGISTTRLMFGLSLKASCVGASATWGRGPTWRLSRFMPTRFARRLVGDQPAVVR